MVKPTMISIAKLASTTDRFKPTFAKSPITGAKVGPIKFKKLCPDTMAYSIMEYYFSFFSPACLYSYFYKVL